VASLPVDPHNDAVPSAPEPQVNLGLTVAAVARRLGVAPATLRTWDRRYGLGPSAHEVGAHRRYSPLDIARLEHMRRLVISGVPPADAARAALDVALPDVPDAEIVPIPVPETVDATDARAGGGQVVGIPGGTPAARGLARAAMALDGPTCQQVINETLDRRGVIWTWDHLLVPVLVGVGHRWQTTGTAIDVEHVLSDSILSCFRDITRRVQEPLNVAPVILSASDQEMHSLALWATAAALAEQGVSARMLGERVPPNVLIQAVRRIGPAVVFVWAQRANIAAAEALAPIRALRPAPVLLLGGPGWQDPIPANMERVTDLTTAVRRIIRAVGH
jgi:MerR family transcriptional regulator, light-induced transcriptional regulator